MQKFELSLLPTSIDTILYKYNYIDNKLWTLIHNEIDFISNTDDSVLISVNQLKYLLDKYYTKDINKIKSLGSEFLHKEINSIYFLYQICIEMENLQYIRFNLNKDKSYHRIIQIEGNKVLQFNFKVTTATLRLHDVYDKDDLFQVNIVLKVLGILSPKKPYCRIHAKELAEKLDLFMEANEDNDDDVDFSMILDILDILESKLEPENTYLLLITDY
jgi:hypothetical protein